MLRILPKLIASLLALLLIGCSTTYKIGKEFDTNYIPKIKIGITTQQEIISYFGQPLRKGISNGDEVYIYTCENVIFASDGAVKREGNTLVVEFNSNLIVKNYYLNIPGKETLLFGYLFHKRKLDKEQQQMAQQY